jgi:serine/threonine protein phosphatase PrpC
LSFVNFSSFSLDKAPAVYQYIPRVIENSKLLGVVVGFLSSIGFLYSNSKLFEMKYYKFKAHTGGFQEKFKYAQFCYNGEGRARDLFEAREVFCKLANSDPEALSQDCEKDYWESRRIYAQMCRNREGGVRDLFEANYFSKKVDETEFVKIKSKIDKLLPEAFDFSVLFTFSSRLKKLDVWIEELQSLLIEGNETVFNALELIRLFNDIYKRDKRLASKVSLYLLDKVEVEETVASYKKNSLIFFLLKFFQDISSTNYRKETQEGRLPLLKASSFVSHEHSLMCEQSIRLLRDFRVEEDSDKADQRVRKHSLETLKGNYRFQYSRQEEWKDDFVDHTVFKRLRGWDGITKEQLKIKREDLGVVKAACTRGSRDSMDDSHFVYQGAMSLLEDDDTSISLLGILDGHGGDGISKRKKILRACVLEELERFLIKNGGKVSHQVVYNASKVAFAKFQNMILREFLEDLSKGLGFRTSSSSSLKSKLRGFILGSGCTALLMLKINGESYLINSGDSRAVLIDPFSKRSITLTKDHEPENQLNGIKKRGGYLGMDKIGITRISDYLSTGRALGDLGVKGVNFRPTVTSLSETCKKYSDLSLEDAILILGCDGLWEMISAEDILDNFSKEDFEIKLIVAALNRAAEDNISVLLMDSL